MVLIPDLLTCSSFFFKATMTFAPAVGYITQIHKMRETKSSDGFSKYILLLCLIANVLRIFYWFQQPLDTVLMLQSCVCISVQLFLISECLSYGSQQVTGSFLSPYNFWNWNSFSEYLVCFVIFSVFACFVPHFLELDKLPWFSQLTISLCALFDAFSSFPQLVSNCKKGNLSNVSFPLVALWLMGDAVRLGYYSMVGAPFQMLACGLFQTFCDFVVVVQLAHFIILHSKREKYDLEEAEPFKV